eukprot:TRINITY_DN3798_c0_g1_i4.p1 TRINITY_DN3798_c0_g1~~TRINITY_DN3798_c0_g1_i4.p1  ORF type:complete len:546 (+),score=150.78 TRINITY_DN3798_c0_g1_i4:54-1640(+)
MEPVGRLTQVVPLSLTRVVGSASQMTFKVGDLDAIEVADDLPVADFIRAESPGLKRTGGHGLVFVALAAVFLSIAIVLVSSSVYANISLSMLKETGEVAVVLTRERGNVVWLDEVLTMSATAAAWTGDAAWVARYNAHAPKLDNAIARLNVLLPPAVAEETQQAESNAALVALEMQVLSIVSNRGNLTRAQEILKSAEYVLHKQAYANGYERTENFVESMVARVLDDGETHRQNFPYFMILPAVFAFVGIIATTFSARHAHLERRALQIREQQVLKEKEVTELLLCQILPKAIVERARLGARNIVESHENVCIAFADIVGFTAMAAEVKPEVLVRLLRGVFSVLDGIALQLGIEKIKTIGDCYMACAGLTTAGSEAGQMLKFLLYVIDASKNFHLPSNTGPKPVVFRSGMHVGNITAGVVGQSKLCYDIWGAAVNIASRAESHAKPNGIAMTNAAYECIGECFLDAHREYFTTEVTVMKGIGETPIHHFLPSANPSCADALSWSRCIDDVSEYSVSERESDHGESRLG